jgi:hypothetical protein
MEEASTNNAAHRWTVTVLCLYAAGATGLIYLFSVYSDALKKEFGLSQSEVESINTVNRKRYFSFSRKPHVVFYIIYMHNTMHNTPSPLLGYVRSGSI